MSQTPTPTAAPAAPKKKLGLFKSKFLWISIGFHALLLIVAGYFVVSTIVARPKPEFKAGPKGPANNEQRHKIQMTKRTNSMSAPAQTQRIVTKGVSAISLPDLPSVNDSSEFNPMAMVGMGAPGSMGGPGGGGGVGGGGAPISFFGLRAKAKDVVFIIDITGSMVSGQKDATTWTRLETEFEKALRSLPPNTNFNVITFGPEAATFRTKLVPATKQEQDAALNFVRGWSPARLLTPGQRPNATTWDSPRGKRHQGTVPSNAFRLAFKTKPDMIIFLSDGEPTRPDSADAVLAEIASLQSRVTKRVKINVIAYCADSGQKFMQDVAQQNQGEYKEIPLDRPPQG